GQLCQRARSVNQSRHFAKGISTANTCHRFSRRGGVKMKRLLNCRASDFRGPITGDSLRDAISASEGRVIMAEIAVQAPPLFAEVTNAELLCAFGADLLLLKGIHFQRPALNGGEERFGADPVSQVKCLTGRLTGVNFEVLPADDLSSPGAFLPAHLEAV